MAGIDKTTLENISGMTASRGASDLLDSTLATMSHRAKMKESQQLGELRSVQLQQAQQEHSEFLEATTQRAVERDTALQYAKAANETVEEDIAAGQQQKRVQAAQLNMQAQQTVMGQLATVSTQEEYDTVVAQNEGVLPPEALNSLAGLAIGSPEYRRAIHQATQTIPQRQKKELLRQEYNLKEQVARAKTTKTGELTTPKYVKEISEGLVSSGMDAGFARDVGTSSAGVTALLNEQQIGVHHKQIASYMSELFRGDPDKYTIQEPRSLMNPFPDKALNTNLLEQDVLNGMQNPETQKEVLSRSGGASTETEMPTSISDEQAELISKQQGIPVDEVKRQFYAQQGKDVPETPLMPEDAPVEHTGPDKAVQKKELGEREKLERRLAKVNANLKLDTGTRNRRAREIRAKISFSNKRAEKAAEWAENLVSLQEVLAEDDDLSSKDKTFLRKRIAVLKKKIANQE